VVQTGAGGGILMAALLGFVIGTVIASQQIYATTMENIEEFATLKALGASRWFVIRVLLVQALASGIAGCLVGVAATFPLVHAAQRFISWIYTPWWLPLVLVPPSLFMCAVAALTSVRAALRIDPARVFRA
jgi:putative ABC transport system permease protein